jgi:tetratricopeptide (TPR) repeat protein
MARIIQRGSFGGGMQGGGGSRNQRARQALSESHFEEAARLTRRQLERKPDDLTARLYLAQALVQMQEPEEAAQHAQRVVSAQPNNAEGQLALAQALTQTQKKGDLDRAEAAARKASALLPRSARPRVQLAWVAMAQRKPKEAKAAADEAIRLEPRMAAAHQVRAVILLQEEDHQGAADASRQAIRYESGMGPAYYTLALSLNELKQSDEAIQALDKAQELQVPIPSASLLGLRGQIKIKQRHYKEALAAYILSQRASGRPGFVAVPLGAVSVIVAAVLDRLGRTWGITLLLAIVVAILFGLGAIPVAGPWIVAVLLLGLVGGMIFGFVSGVQSGRLPLGRFASSNGVLLASAIIAAIVLGATFLAVYLPPMAGHPPIGAWTVPTGLAIGGVFGLVAAFFSWRSLSKSIAS